MKKYKFKTSPISMKILSWFVSGTSLLLPMASLHAMGLEEQYKETLLKPVCIELSLGKFSPIDMFHFCEENSSSNIKYFFVFKLELKESRRKFFFLKYKFTNVCTIPGTRKFHKFVSINKEELMVYPFSISGKGEKKTLYKPGDAEYDFAKVKDVKVGQIYWLRL